LVSILIGIFIGIAETVVYDRLGLYRRLLAGAYASLWKESLLDGRRRPAA